ncbi:MAG: transglycosylase SLT domain-containing protein [Candidatus Delongbacteria bacterium]|nr:transglycosylase SLT domain-containing protein [Candidatus Delongbacteria bacterium]MBN2834174.1 transglycosylase SLT domain-containing protein [Candidatus Delongbacteria bacterium]
MKYFIIVGMFLFFAFAEESDVYKEYMKNANQEREQYNENVMKERKEWEDYVQKERKQWAELVGNVRKQWGDFVPTTNKVWSDYSKDFSSHSKVDFENDLIEIEVLMDSDENPDTKLNSRFEEMMKEEDPYTKKPILENQISENGKIVEKRNTKEVIASKKKKEEIVVGDDGRARKKYTVSIQMAPNSLKERAERYLPIVKKYSETYKLDPALVMAFIHTESAFNPKAYSRRPDGTPMACGLMQLIPTQAARDAHNALYGKDVIVKPEFLFDPDENIKMGTWYINNLKKWWNKKVDNLSEVKNEYLTVSSYNQGMGTIYKRFKANDLGSKSEDSTYKILNTDPQISKEGRDYIERVIDRRKLYR